MIKFWILFAAILSGLLLTQCKSRESDSKKLHILWTKFKELKEDVEQLKSLHQKEQRDSSSCSSSLSSSSEEKEDEDDSKEEDGKKEEGSDEDNGGGGSKEENKEQNNYNEYTKFPIRYHQIRLTSTGTEYNACTVQIEAPVKTKFICYTENSQFMFPVESTESPPKPVPNPRHEMIGGLHHVTCYSRSGIIQLSVGIEPQYTTFVAVVPASGRNSLNDDLSDLNVEFKEYTNTEHDDYREARVDFRFQNKTTPDNIDGILLWKNESEGTLQWTNDGKQQNINLTTNVSSVSESETMVLLRVPVDEVEEIHGSTSVYLEYRLEVSRGINLRFDMQLLGKTSLLEPLSLTEIAKLNGNRDKTFTENQRGNIQCSFFTHPTAAVDILKKDDKGWNRVLETFRTYYNGIVFVVKIWENVTDDVSGQYLCRATAGSRIVEDEFNVDVVGFVRILNANVIKSDNLVTINIEATAERSKSINMECHVELSDPYELNDAILFRERSIKNDSSLVSSLDTLDEDDNNSLSDYLDKYSPLVIDYARTIEFSAQNDSLKKNISVVLDLEMVPETPSQVSCTARNIEPDRMQVDDHMTNWITLSIN